MDEKWTTYSAVLATESAMADAINKDLKRGAGTLRDACDAMIVATYETTGAKSYDLKVDGEKVGTYSVTVSKAKTEAAVYCEVVDGFVEWAKANNCLARMVSHDSKAVLAWVSSHGEVPDGIRIVEREIPEKVSGTVVKVSPAYKMEIAERLMNQVGIGGHAPDRLEE